MKTRLFLCLILIFPSFLPCASAAETQDLQDFILQLEKSLQSQDFESYLEAFSPELREEQRGVLSLYFETLKMETSALRWANKASVKPDEPTLFLQVIFQNAISAVIETWQLNLAQLDGRWIIKGKKVRGGLSQLYKIKIPSEHVERVDEVEIKHADISFIFKDALIFYDNIPDLETALLVIGKGHVSFSPSDPNEKHQLELIFKSRTLQDTVDYAYLRFSNSFFERNIRIKKKEDTSGSPASDVEKNRASALFMKHQLRFFTIQSSLSPEPLSFVPQGDEVAIKFGGRKAGELSYIYSTFAEEEVTLYEESRNRFLNIYSPEAERGKRRMVITFSQRFDVQNYDIELDFEPQKSYLSVKARLEVTARLDALDAVKVRFNPDLEILRITDEERRELFFTQDKTGKLLYIYFLEPVARGKIASLEILYRGRLEPPAQVVDAIVAARQDNSIAFMTPPRYETWLFSQSSYWYPCPTDEDYFTARVKIIVPPGYSSVANGLLLEEGKLNGVQRVTEINKIGSTFSVFETKKPVKYLTFLVGKLALIQKGTGSLPLSYYAASDVRIQKKNILEEAQKILLFYESQFGPYPFETLRVVQRLWRTGGGHSPASFVVLNDIPRTSDGRLPVNIELSPYTAVDLFQWKEYFLAHEIAHQWWGQGVTSARYRDQWLSEGLAQFSSVLYLRSKYNHGAFSSILKRFSKWTGKKSSFGPITLGSRLSFLDFDAYQTIIYNKTTLVLNMLVDLLGEEVFFAGLQEFFQEHKYSAATTGQFKRTMERVSGKSLDDFFSFWFDSHLLPECRVAASVTKKENNFFLQVRVDQLGDVFIFPLWVEWEEGEGQNVRREKVIIDKKNQDFSIPLQGPAKKIKINPDGAVPGKLTTDRG